MEALRVLTVEQSKSPIDLITLNLYVLCSSAVPQHLLRPSQLIIDSHWETLEWN